MLLFLYFGIFLVKPLDHHTYFFDKSMDVAGALQLLRNQLTAKRREYKVEMKHINNMPMWIKQ